MAYHTFECVCVRGEAILCRGYVCAKTPQQAIERFQLDHDEELELERPGQVRFEAEACE